MKFNLDIPKMGYIIVYKKREGFHPLEKLICDEQEKEGFSKEDAEYVHVEISGGGNESINASFPYVRSIKIANKHKGRYIKIMVYKNREFMLSKRYKVAYYAATLSNRAYGLASLIWFKLNNYIFKDRNVLASRHLPYCSFLASWSLKKVFPQSFEDSGSVMPASFLDSNKFNVIWEGVIE